MNGDKKRRPRRTKADIINCINKAAKEQITVCGFSNILVTDIIKKAKIEPIVFYNRFENLDNFLNEFVKNYDYWFSDVLVNLKNKINTKEGLTEIFEKLFIELNRDSVMLELLRWEIANGNSTTIRTAMLREIHVLPLVKEVETLFSDKEIDIAALTSLIIGGMYYLSLHKDRSSFSGIDINKPEGISRILKSMRFFVEKIYEENKLYEEKKRIAYKLQKSGICEDIIKQCVWNEK